MIVTLTTDFGICDPYVGTMKGVLLGINPGLTIVDLCHTVPPQNIRWAAFQLLCSYSYFPSDTIHVVVVDPGVGSKRSILLVVSARGRFIAPDNGVLSYVLRDVGEFNVYRVTNPRYWLSSVSSTFHGRDIIAPVAAYLSVGVPVEELGEPVSQFEALALPTPRRLKNGVLVGEVIYIDGFGNLITNIRERDLDKPIESIELKGNIINKLSRTYVGGGKLKAMIGSNGFLEIAVRNGSAAKELGVSTGARVRIKFSR